MTTATSYETPAIQTEEKKDWLSRLGDFFATAYVVMHFVPILTSICWIIYFATGQSRDLMYILAPIMLIGLISAALTHPLRIIWFVVKRVAYGFWHPLVSFPVIPVNIVVAAIGAGVCATFALGVVFFAPAILTICYFFEE